MTYTRRYNAHDLDDSERETVITLVRSLGHDRDDIAAVIAITWDEIGTRIHLTEYLRNEYGFHYSDIAADHVVSRPRVHDIAPEQLPASLRPTAGEVS